VKFAAGVIRAPIHSWPAAVLESGWRVSKALRGFWQSASASVLKVAVSELIASARYRPGFYPGELTLFTPVEREPGLPSPQAIWIKHAGALSLVETAGTHSKMFTAANAESVAASLTRCFLVCSKRTSPLAPVSQLQSMMRCDG
jgi:hypothetical protein